MMKIIEDLRVIDEKCMFEMFAFPVFDIEEKYEKYDDIEMFILDRISFWEDIGFEFILNYLDEENVIGSMSDILVYCDKNNIFSDSIEDFKKFYDFVRLLDPAACKIGRQVGNTYYKYLDKERFGVVTNSVYTVGHIINQREFEKYPEFRGYSYVFNKNINILGSPKTDLCCLFKQNEDMISVKILLARNGKISDYVSTVVGYIYNFGTMRFPVDKDITEISKEIAKRFDQLVPIIYDIADNYPSLYYLLQQDGPLEKITATEHITDDRTLTDNIIGRWIRIRGKNSDQPTVRSEKYNNNEDFDITYDNVVGLYYGDPVVPGIEYDGNILKIKAVNRMNGQTVYEESCKMSGPLNDFSQKIAMMIEAIIIRKDFYDVKKLR